MTDSQQPRNRGSPLDLGGELARVEQSLQMDQKVLLVMTRPFKRALTQLAVRRQTSLSNVIREATTNWLRQEYPEFDGMYRQALEDELQARKHLQKRNEQDVRPD